MSCLAQQKTQSNSEQNADNPKGRSGSEMNNVIAGVEALANEARENGTYHGCDCEGEKIDSASGASFYLIRIGFLDDGVRNHGCARSDAEDESC